MRCGSSAPDASWMSTRAAPSSGNRCAWATSVVGLAGGAGAVDEAGVELAPGRGDRLARLLQVRDVVQRVVQAEDVDPALGGASDESPDEIAADGPRADEKAAAERHRERRLGAGLERANPLPRALDATLDGRVEAAAAGDLEVGESGRVEDLGQVELRRGRQHRRERLLSEQAKCRVDEGRHRRGAYPRRQAREM